MADAAKITFLAAALREYGGNVLIYAACSSSFFAWLTGSFILHEMGYGPTAIGLSYIPQAIAPTGTGCGCRALLQKWWVNRCCRGCW